MQTIYIGVDHGKKGAFAAINEDGEILKILPMPLLSNTINCFQLFSWLSENFDDYDTEVIITGEELHAIFGSAAKSTFTFGKEIGKAIGVIECLQMKYVEVKAREWQKYIFADNQIEEIEMPYKTKSKVFKMKRDTKAMASRAAIKLWPENYPNKWNDGVIDALLIAEYARRNYKGDAK